MNKLTLSSMRLLVALFLGLTAFFSAVAGDYQIGTFYYPGWKDKQAHNISPTPWKAIKNFTDHEPLLGWYDEGSDKVAQQHIDWMHEYGIDFVVYDWYWSKDNKVLLEHALASYMRAPNRDKVKFSLLWANHDRVPSSRENFEQMVTYWARYYLQRPEYLRVENKPVVFIFSADMLKKDAEKFGATSKELLDSAQAIAKQMGLPGIYFVAGTGANSPMIDSYASMSGYSALSAYNYHQGLKSPVMSRSYSELDQAYRDHWSRFLTKGNLPLIVPMTSGWDKRPWGGSKDPLHDLSIGTADQFEAHLKTAKAAMNASKTANAKMGVICCWNEFGEGSYIEPTKKDGFSYLEKIKKVFGAP